MMRNICALLFFLFVSAEIPAQTDSSTLVSGKLDTIVVREYDKHGKLSKTTTWMGSDFKFTEDFYKIGDVSPSQWDSLEAMRASAAIVRKYNNDGRVKWEEKIVKEETVWHRDYYYIDSIFGYEEYDPNAQSKGILITNIQVFEFFPDSTPRIVGAYVDRKKEGPYLTYYPNGAPQCICYYKKGERDSIQNVYDQNGKLMYNGNYVNGKEHGVVTNYHANGNLESRYKYVNGKVEDTTYDYHKNGQLWTVMVYRDGKPMEVISEFDEEGNPRPLGTLKGGHGTVLTYYNDNTLAYIEHYRNGIMVKKKYVK